MTLNDYNSEWKDRKNGEAGVKNKNSIERQSNRFEIVQLGYKKEY